MCCVDCDSYMTFEPLTYVRPMSKYLKTIAAYMLLVNSEE